MKTDIRIIRKAEQSTGTWAGGTTTQLAIWPPESDYKLRNFEWRISSARVDLDESTFTALPGVHRLIMILEGKVRLTHEGHHDTTLDAFDQDSFEGGWNTLSRGRCIDFNLMTAAGCCGTLAALKVDKELLLPLFPDLPDSAPREITEAFYSRGDSLKVVVREKEDTFETTLDRDDFLLLRRAALSKEVVEVTLIPPASGATAAIRTTVWHRKAAQSIS